MNDKEPTVSEIIDKLTVSQKKRLEKRLAELESHHAELLEKKRAADENIDDVKANIEAFREKVIKFIKSKYQRACFKINLKNALIISQLGKFGLGILAVSIFFSLFAGFQALLFYIISASISFLFHYFSTRREMKDYLTYVDNMEYFRVVYIDKEGNDSGWPFSGESFSYSRQQFKDFYIAAREDGATQIDRSFVSVMDSDDDNSLYLHEIGQRYCWYINEENFFLKNYGGYIEDGVAKYSKMLKNDVKKICEYSNLKDEIESVIISMNDIKEQIEECIDLKSIWSRIILPDEVKITMLKRIEMFKNNDPATPRGLLLFGPPGTGKTMVAKAIADSVECHFIKLSMPDLKKGFIGQSGQAVRSIWDEARSYERCLIFIDECESIFGRRGSADTDSFSDDIVQAFLAEWDGIEPGESVWVIGATNRHELLDDAIVSRFGAKIEIGLPDEKCRAKILELEFIRFEVSLDITEYMIESTAGLSGRDISTLARDIKTEAFPEKPEEKHFTKIIKSLKKRSSTAVNKDAKWETLVLDDELKDDLKTVCAMLRNIESVRKQNISIPKGMLLYGPPGTGKTQIARTLANESGLQFIGITTSDLKAGWIGQSNQKVTQIFAKARSNSPSILFIDELEVVAPSRNQGGADQFTNEIVAQLLQEIDGIKNTEAHVYIIAATNIKEMIDPAVLSRLSKKIHIKMPDEEARKRLFNVFLKGKPINFNLDQFCEDIAKKTIGFSGRDIKNLVASAEQEAFERALKKGELDKITIELQDFSN